MSRSMIAAQMYTLRDFCKTTKDIASSMRKVRKLGYEAIQTSGLGPIEPEELKRIVDGEGLKICATHVPYELMRDEPETVVEEHKLLECEYTAIGGLPGEYRSEQGFRQFAKEASEVARRLAGAGLTFGYHNHSFELEKFGDRTGLAILYEESDPRYFKAEIDTYWVQHGGGDPVWWINKLAGRVPLLHLKDMAMRGSEQLFAEVGEGNLNWPGILEAAKRAATAWYIVEQDICQRDPFESLGISLRNLKAMGLQ